MKRLLSLLAVIVILLGFSNAAPAAQQFIRIGTSSVGGGFYLIGNTLAQLGQQKMGNVNFTAVTSSTTKNVLALEKQEYEMAIMQSNVYNSAWDGTDVFKKPYKKLRFIAGIYEMYIHIMANTDANIKTIPDFKGKAVDFGPIGFSSYEQYTGDIFKFYGMTIKDVKTERFGKSEFEEAFKNGNIQGHFWATTIPNAQISELIRAGKATLLPLPKDALQSVVKNCPYYVASAIPAGTYAGIDKDIPTVSAVGALVCHDGMSTEMVYAITKMIFENIDFLKERQPSYFRNFSLKTALSGQSIPLHPGAEKYYREVGLIK